MIHVSYFCLFASFCLTVLFHTSFVCCCVTVENLNVLVPTLLDKLKVVEDKKPVNNVTTNIMRIRELIAQARSVAKKVSSALLSELTFSDSPVQSEPQ